MELKCDFYLTSIEYQSLENPRECWNIGRLSNGHRDDLMIVKVIPSVSDHLLREERLILASRHEGNPIFSPTEYPVHVYVIKPNINVENGDVINDSDYNILYWGEIYLTMGEAKDKKF